MVLAGTPVVVHVSSAGSFVLLFTGRAMSGSVGFIGHDTQEPASRTLQPVRLPGFVTRDEDVGLGDDR